ncbi:MAG: hypothetical protein KIT84_34090 [Labilithrix sp.]|nr:hypothetical protein [Labilithrix sp.]MCW5816077.1 hypothetical protein [Labilithrix sp.]
MKLRVLVALAAFAPMFLAGRGAFGQMSDNEKKAAARAAYTEGVELQDKGKYAEALADFEKAQKLFDAPTHLLRIAECQEKLGRLVEAVETYETLSRLPLEANAPDVFKQAQAQGAKELETLRPRIPTLRVNVTPEPSTLPNLQINLNDKTMPIETIGIARPINPGQYKITATASGWGTRAPVDVDVKEKDAKSVDVTLEKGATGGLTTPETSDKPASTGPTGLGLLVGLRPLAFLPFGKVDENTNFKDYAGPGVGGGIDIAGRIANRFLVGGSAEIAFLRAPERFIPGDPTILDGGQGAASRSNISVLSEYIGVFGGFVYDNDSVSPIATINAGYRYIQRAIEFTGPTGVTKKLDDNVNGLQAGLHAGVSIPLGPMRLVPLADVSAGQLSDRGCKTASDLGLVDTSSTSCTDPGSGFFFMAGLSVGIYYNVDFGKK